LPDPYVLLLYRRVLTGPSPLLAQISFDVAVLERYLGRPGVTLKRSDSMGRLQKQGGWSLDFGIASPGGAIPLRGSPGPGGLGIEGPTVHLSLGDLLERLPPEEREHWVEHVAAPPLSQTYLKARLSPGACIDDGEVRDW